jgi:SAM-dependent methyltransferase
MPSASGVTSSGFVDNERPDRERLAASFTHVGVAEAYRHRPPYPEAVLDLLESLITDRPRDVLDIGAGEGALARPLAGRVDHVDAVDISPAMVEAGRRRPGGDRPNLRWIVGPAQSVDLRGPYALATAGASLHWMPAAQTMRRLGELLSDRAFFAVIDYRYDDMPWHADLLEVIRRHSRSPSFDPAFSAVEALSDAGLLEIAGRAVDIRMPFRQQVASYVEQFHSTSSLARELMPAEEAAAFDRAVEEIVRPFAVDGILAMEVATQVIWGRPHG